MIQATLTQEPSREDVMGDFRGWIVAHICDFGREMPPRYPAAPDVYRANRAQDIIVNVDVLHWESYDSDDLDTVYEAYWRMRRNGTFIRRAEGPTCPGDSRSFGVFRRWATGAITTSLIMDLEADHACQMACRMATS